MDDIIELEILGWEKYQHHNGKRTYDWFKLSAFLFEDPEINMLTGPQFKTWIYLLCLCAKFRRSTIRVHIKLLSSTIGVHPKSTRSTIFSLQQYHIVRIISGTTEEKRIEENRIDTTSIGEVFKKTKSKRQKISAIAGEVALQPSYEVNNFIGIFVKAYQDRYGEKARPDLSGKVQGQIRQLIKNMGMNRASELIQVYMQMKDKWFETKCHDFTTFMNNIQKISVAHDTGKQLSDVNDIDIADILRRSELSGNGRI